VPVYPFTQQIAFRAGQIDANQQARGVKVPFPDLLIGATALCLGYAVVTSNPRHFRMLPDLSVSEL
jgi:predicted nucleic acid-binding protein